MTKKINQENYSRRKARKKIKTIDQFKNLSKNKVIHHIDQNPFNNDLSNLCIMSNSTHTALHWALIPTKMKSGRKSKSLNQRMKELEEALILYNFNL